MKKHKHAVESRPSHGLAYHPQRGVRAMRHLKAGWRWITEAEAIAHDAGETLPTAPLRKPGVWIGAVDGIKR